MGMGENSKISIFFRISPKTAKFFSRSFIYAINLNETGYLVLFFLTEKIYEKICLKKGLILGNSIFKNYFL